MCMYFRTHLLYLLTLSYGCTVELILQPVFVSVLTSGHSEVSLDRHMAYLLIHS